LVASCGTFTHNQDIQPRYFQAIKEHSNIPFVQAKKYLHSPKVPSTSTMPLTKSETKVPVKSILEIRAENAAKLKEWKEQLAQEAADARRSREKLEERIKKLEEEDTR
jgi:FtsZ-binding cell division protein ZapB